MVTAVNSMNRSSPPNLSVSHPMTTFVSLLRGINVAGHRPVPMAALRAAYAALKFTRVRSHLQSGNVVFDAPTSDEAEMVGAIQDRIADDFGHEVRIVLRDASAFTKSIAQNPLAGIPGIDVTHFHATLLERQIPPAVFNALTLPIRGGERAALVGDVVYLHCPHGYGDTKLNNGFFERKLGVTATTRNWRTLLALDRLARDPSR